MKDPYWRRCSAVRVVDGDTIDFEIDLGYRCYAQHRIRLLGVDAPEVYGASGAEREAGLAARAFVSSWLDEHAQHSDGYYPFRIRSEKADSFGRYLGAVECAQEHNLNFDLIESGHAQPYEGRA